MSTPPQKTVAHQLNAAQRAISNTLANPEIQSLVAANGYTAAKMNEGLQRYNDAVKLINGKTAGMDDQRDAIAQLQAAEKEARDAYQALAQIARAAFAQDNVKLTTLGLNDPIPPSTAGFIAAATRLFDNALNHAELRTALAELGYTQAKLRSERAKIAAYDRANQRRAQPLTHEEETALAALNTWIAQYLKSAKVALRNRKQLLEQLGIRARTSKR